MIEKSSNHVVLIQIWCISITKSTPCDLQPKKKKKKKKKKEKKNKKKK